MNIAGLNKAAVLAALFNASKQQGMGFMDARGASQMTVADAEQVLRESRTPDFDYLRGRVMKISLEGDTVDTWCYNRDNGQGAAERALAHLRAEVAA